MDAHANNGLSLLAFAKMMKPPDITATAGRRNPTFSLSAFAGIMASPDVKAEQSRPPPQRPLIAHLPPPPPPPRRGTDHVSWGQKHTKTHETNLVKALPVELLILIDEFLDPVDHQSLRATCRGLRTCLPIAPRDPCLQTSPLAERESKTLVLGPPPARHVAARSAKMGILYRLQ